MMMMMTLLTSMSWHNLGENWYVDYSHLATLLLLSCSCSAPTLLLPSSSFGPAYAVPLPSSCQAPVLFLPGSALLCSALLLPCSCPAPTLLVLQPRSCFAPALLLPCSWSCQPQFGSLHRHHQHLTTFFGTVRGAFSGIDAFLLLRYECRSCELVGNLGACAICIYTCHKDHDVVYKKYSSFFCDCGAGELGTCKAMTKNVPNTKMLDETLEGNISEAEAGEYAM